MMFKKWMHFGCVWTVIVTASVVGSGWQCGAAVPLAAVDTASKRPAEVLRGWTPRDSIGVSYYVEDQQQPDSWTLRALSGEGPDAIVPSPNGKYFFYVVHRGDLPSDTNIYELRVYLVSAVGRWLARGIGGDRAAPLHEVELRSSSSSLPAISSARWSTDSGAVVFLGMSDDGTMQVKRLDVQTGTVSTWTSGTREIASFQMSGDNLLLEEVIRPNMPTPQYPMEPVRRGPNGEVVPPATWVGFHSHWKGLVIQRAGQPRELPGEMVDAALARDGRWAVGRFRVLAGDSAPTSTFMLVDLRDARVDSILGTPVGSRTAEVGDMTKKSVTMPAARAYWSPDGTHAILVNTKIPQQREARGTAPEKAASGSYIVDYELKSNRWRILEPLVSAGAVGDSEREFRYVSDVEWLEPQGSLLVKHGLNGKPAGGTLYRWTAKGWRAQSLRRSIEMPEPLGGRLSVVLRQDQNTPPAIYVSDGKRERVLTEPDEALRGIRLARQEQVEWREPDGKTVFGGLTLPRDRPPGIRVPLVIQAYYYLPELFLPDGPSSAAYAAQSLAAEGIAVLQMDMWEHNNSNDVGPNEGPRFVSRVDAAVESLVNKGIVDPRRVGLTGFSRAGYRTYYAITHPGKVRLAAAVCDDSFLGSYSSYLQSGAWFPQALASNFELGAGGSFWQHKSEWLKYETSFNVDRVETPVMFALHGNITPGASNYPLPAMEVLGSFFMNKKPLEYLFFPEGSHALVRPRERLAIMTALVDWMRFWLQDYEDPDPSKSEEYARWRPMRGMLPK